MKRNGPHLGFQKYAAVLAALSFVLVASAIDAQDRSEGFSVGVGFAAESGTFVGEDNTTIGLPILRYESEAFSIGLPDGLRVTLFRQESLRVSAVVTPRLSGIDSSDAAELGGFDRQITADGGFQFRYDLAERTELNLRAVTELTDEHGGSEVGLSVSQRLPVGGFPLRLGAGLTWQSEELASYRFGVSAADAAASTFAEYDPGDIVFPQISVSTAIPLNERVSVIASLRADLLPDEVADSPIVDEDVSIGAFFGLSYNF